MDSTLERGRSAPAPRPLAIARWLFIVAAMIVTIVAVGGITRLTESGVSITEWKPVSGALPPLSEAAWQAEFDAYRQTPQYIQINGPAGTHRRIRRPGFDSEHGQCTNHSCISRLRSLA